MIYALCSEELIVCENRRKSAVKFHLRVVAVGKSSLSPFLGMQGVGEEGVSFRELSTQHS